MDHLCRLTEARNALLSQITFFFHCLTKQTFDIDVHEWSFYFCGIKRRLILIEQIFRFILLI